MATLICGTLQRHPHQMVYLTFKVTHISPALTASSLHTHIHTHTHTYACTRPTHMRARTHTHAHAHTHTHTLIHAHSDTRTHIYTDTHTNIKVKGCLWVLQHCCLEAYCTPTRMSSFIHLQRRCTHQAA